MSAGPAERQEVRQIGRVEENLASWDISLRLKRSFVMNGIMGQLFLASRG